MAYIVYDVGEDLVGFAADDAQVLTLVKPKSKAFVDTLSETAGAATGVVAFHSKANWSLRIANDRLHRMPERLLFRRDSQEPLLRLTYDTPPTPACRFNHDGTQIAWGHIDGTVSVYDLPTIDRGLSHYGMGWSVAPK
jgi:hypothetical protein